MTTTPRFTLTVGTEQYPAPVPTEITEVTEAGATPGWPLRVRVHRPVHDVVVLRARGDLDIAAEPRFTEVLRHRLTCTAPTVVLDLSAVSFLDTTGAVALLEAATRSGTSGKHLRVISSPAVDRLLGLLEVSDRFAYAGSVDEVVTAASESDRTGLVPTVGAPQDRVHPRPRQPLDGKEPADDPSSP